MNEEEEFSIGELVSYKLFDIYTNSIVHRKGRITGKDGLRWTIDNEIFLFPDWIFPLSKKQKFNKDEL